MQPNLREVPILPLAKFLDQLFRVVRAWVPGTQSGRARRGGGPQQLIERKPKRLRNLRDEVRRDRLVGPVEKVAEAAAVPPDAVREAALREGTGGSPSILLIRAPTPS